MKLFDVDRGQRFAMTQFGDGDVILVLAQKMPCLALKAGEIDLADLRQVDFGALAEFILEIGIDGGREA